MMQSYECWGARWRLVWVFEDGAPVNKKTASIAPSVVGIYVNHAVVWLVAA